MIFRLTQKLNGKIKAGKLTAIPLDENPYADWSCHLFTVGRIQYIILSNTRTLYSCVMYGKGITNRAAFIERALSTIREFTEADGQASSYEKYIGPESETVQFAKTLNRSVTGSMNELIYIAKMALAESQDSLREVSFYLNDTLLSALVDTKGETYARPQDAFRHLLTDCSKVNDESESCEDGKSEE